MDQEERPDKLEVARALLERGSVFVYLDPRADGVAVPEWFGKQPQLVLQFGLNLPVPISDLTFDEAGVFGTLSFNRTPFGCTVPWDAVFALVGDDGMGMVWQEDLPEEIANEVEQKMERAGKPAERGPRRTSPSPESAAEASPLQASPLQASPLQASPFATKRSRGPQLRAIDGGAASPAKISPADTESEPGAGQAAASKSGDADSSETPSADDELSSSETNETVSEDERASPPRRGHLRLIK